MSDYDKEKDPMLRDAGYGPQPYIDNKMTSARVIAEDLNEALKALKQSREIMLRTVLHHGTDAYITEAVQEASRILANYPNLK